MNLTQLYKRLLVVSGITGVILAVLHYYQLLGAYPDFAWVCWSFFSLITPFVLGLASMSNKSSTAGKAVYVVLGAMGLKFVFCLIMILLYAIIVQPESARFILPFFVFYIIYGIVETQFLLQLVKHDQPSAIRRSNT